MLKALGVSFNWLKVPSLSKLWFQMSTCTALYSVVSRAVPGNKSSFDFQLHVDRREEDRAEPFTEVGRRRCRLNSLFLKALLSFKVEPMSSMMPFKPLVSTASLHTLQHGGGAEYPVCAA